MVVALRVGRLNLLTGIGAITEVASVQAYVEKLKREYAAARRRLAL